MKKVVVLVLEANNEADLAAVGSCVDRALDGALSFRDAPANGRVQAVNPVLIEDHDSGPFLVGVDDADLALLRAQQHTGEDSVEDQKALDALLDRSTPLHVWHWSFEAWAMFRADAENG